MTSTEKSNTPPWVVLGIESSCDETGVAVYHEQHGLLAQAVHSQTAVHTAYGGVVPELASRDHIRRLTPLLHQVLRQTGLSLRQINGIACTAGPGLAGALLVGTSFSHGLATALDVPVIGIHHMEGHLLAPLLSHAIPFPFLALLVSGGHTQLVSAQGPGVYQLLGETLDDAAGEALDKTARLLQLPWPGGPALAALAHQGRPGRYHFPRPMQHHEGLDFSFSGLKTSAMQAIVALGGNPGEQQRADIARAFLDAVIDTLAMRCAQALQQTGNRTLVAGGGVVANEQLRHRLCRVAADRGAQVAFPPPEICTDNGAMIAFAGFLRLRAGERDTAGFTVYPRWSLARLAAPGA